MQPVNLPPVQYFNEELFNKLKKASEPRLTYTHLLNSFKHDLRISTHYSGLADRSRDARYDPDGEFKNSTPKIERNIRELKYSHCIFRAFEYIVNRNPIPQMEKTSSIAWLLEIILNPETPLQSDKSFDNFTAKRSIHDLKMLSKIARLDIKTVHKIAMEMIQKSALQLICGYYFDKGSTLNHLQSQKNILKKFLVSGSGNVDLMTFENFNELLNVDITKIEVINSAITKFFEGSLANYTKKVGFKL